MGRKRKREQKKRRRKKAAEAGSVELTDAELARFRELEAEMALGSDGQSAGTVIEVGDLFSLVGRAKGASQVADQALDQLEEEVSARTADAEAMYEDAEARMQDAVRRTRRSARLQALKLEAADGAFARHSALSAGASNEEIERAALELLRAAFRQRDEARAHGLEPPEEALQDFRAALLHVRWLRLRQKVAPEGGTPLRLISS